MLLRAGEPVEGEERMRENRGWARVPSPGDLAGGPGKLCQALAIGRELDGVPLGQPPLYITKGEPVAESEIVAGPRIGVDYAEEAAALALALLRARQSARLQAAAGLKISVVARFGSRRL